MKLLRFTPALFLLAIAPCIVSAQQKPPQAGCSECPAFTSGQDSLPLSIGRIEHGMGTSGDYQIVADQHDIEAIPLLKSHFDDCKDPYRKGKIANALERLGVRDGPYWKYLADRALESFQDPPPQDIALDANGMVLRNPPQAFLDWASRHHLSRQEAQDRVMLFSSGPILDIASSGDPRAIPILRKALLIGNELLTARAAEGLAALHDNASVPIIIRICRHSSKVEAELIARALVYFDSPSAQRAANHYLPKFFADFLREQRAKGQTPF